jgi:hypothetical protein
MGNRRKTREDRLEQNIKSKTAKSPRYTVNAAQELRDIYERRRQVVLSHYNEEE